MASTSGRSLPRRIGEVMARIPSVKTVRQRSGLWLVPLATLLVSSCSEWQPDPDAWTWVIYALSPSGGSFTMEHYNELGAGGGIRGPDGPFVFEGTDTLQEVMVSVPLTEGFDPSLQEVRGTFSGDYLLVGFGTRTYRPGGTLLEESTLRAGVLSGSLRSESGPNPQVSPCSVRYGASEPGGSSYRFEFRMTSDVASMCREGPAPPP